MFTTIRLKALSRHLAEVVPDRPQPHGEHMAARMAPRYVQYAHCNRHCIWPVNLCEPRNAALCLLLRTDGRNSRLDTHACVGQPSARATATHRQHQAPPKSSFNNIGAYVHKPACAYSRGSTRGRNKGGHSSTGDSATINSG